MRKLHCSVPENWCCESCRLRNIEEQPAKKVKSEKTIAPTKEFLAVKNEENPMLAESDNKPQNGIRKPVCTNGTSSKILSMRKKEDYLVQVPLPFNNLVSVPHDREDASKKGEISPALRSLPSEFEGNHMLGNSDDMPLDGMRSHPNIDCSNKFPGMGKNESVPVPSKQVSNPLTRGSSRSGDNSKVKFISAEEATLLASGSKAKGQTARASLGTVRSFAKRTSSVPATEASKACLQKGNSNSISRTPPGYNKPLTHDNIQFGTSIWCPPVKAPRESHISSRVCKPSTSERLMGIDDKLFIPRPGAVKSVSGTCRALSQPNGSSINHEAYRSPAKHAGSAESSKYNGNTTFTPSKNEDLMPTMDNASGYREAYRSPSKYAESKYNGKPTFTPSNDEDLIQAMKNASGGAPFADVQFKSSDAQESVLPLLPAELFKGKIQNHLDPDALWKGSFEIYDAICHSDFYEGIEAHRPTIVSRKVCEVSKQMPKKLQLKLHPRIEIWPQIFRKECPTANDIALYFLPGDSSKKKYIYLLEVIEMDDLAMRADLGGLELLIFTSKQLPVDCQRPDMQLYLWGIFRRLKDTKISHLEEGLSYTPAPDTDNAEEADMEIDMVAGKDVGRKDKPVPRPLSFGSGKSSEIHLHMNGQKVSCSQLVSSSSWGRKRVRFSTDRSTSNLKRMTDNRVLDGTPDVLSYKYKEKETERSVVSVPKSALLANKSTLRSSDSWHLIDQHHHGPYDECTREPPPSVKANRLKVADYSIPDVPPGFSKLNRIKVADYSIPDVPPGFSKLSANVATREKSSLKSEPKKPTIQKVVDGSTHFSEPINLKREFHTSVAGYKKEKAVVGATHLRTNSNMPPVRDMDISPGFSKQLDYEDNCRSSEEICKNEKDEHHSFDTTNNKYNDPMLKGEKDEYHSLEFTKSMDVYPGFLKQLERKNHSKAILKREKDEFHSSKVTKSWKENDQFISSQASSKKAKDVHRSFEAFSERVKDEYDSSKSPDRNTIAILGSSEVGDLLKDAGNVACASSKGSIQGSGLQAQKSIIATESPQVPFMYHQVSHHGLESPLRMDSAADCMVDTSTHMDSRFTSGSTSCLELFPSEVESATQEIDAVGTDNSFLLSNAQCAKDSCPAKGEESLVLSLSRPQYLNNGNNWITVLSREQLQKEDCGEELQLTL